MLSRQGQPEKRDTIRPWLLLVSRVESVKNRASSLAYRGSEDGKREHKHTFHGR